MKNDSRRCPSVPALPGSRKGSGACGSTRRRYAAARSVGLVRVRSWHISITRTCASGVEGQLRAYMWRRGVARRVVKSGSRWTTSSAPHSTLAPVLTPSPSSRAHQLLRHVYRGNDPRGSPRIKRTASSIARSKIWDWVSAARSFACPNHGAIGGIVSPSRRSSGERHTQPIRDIFSTRV